MKHWRVTVREIVSYEYEIEADDEATALVRGADLHENDTAKPCEGYDETEVCEIT